MSLNQSIVADHLDLSQQAVSQLLQRLGCDLATATLDQIRVAYIRHLRAMAAGQGGDALAAERLRLTAARRIKAELQARTMAGELVEAAAVSRGITDAAAAMRASLERIGDRIGPRLAELTDPDACTDLVSREIDDALVQLAKDLRAGKHRPEAVE